MKQKAPATVRGRYTSDSMPAEFLQDENITLVLAKSLTPQKG
jgi:hypothetical protein